MSARNSDGQQRQGVPPPYPGARAFGRLEGSVFFGREAESRETRAGWLSERVLVMHGPQASGKTSLLQAGVLPILAAAGSADVLPIGRVTPRAGAGGGNTPSPSAYLVNLVSSWAGTGEEFPPGTSVLGFLRERQAAARRNGPARPLLAAVDQFEELFAISQVPDDRERLLDELAIALETIPALRLLLVIRDDYLAALADYGDRFPLNRQHYISLGPLGDDAAMNAIAGPAARVGWPFAEDAVERLAEDLRVMTVTDATDHEVAVYRGKIEPLHLQIACRSLWATLPFGAGGVTSALLRAWGDVDKALGDFYDSAVGAVAADNGVSEARLRDWLRLTFVTALGTRNTIGRGNVATNDVPGEVADDLVGRRVLAAEFRDQEIWYQLSHDRFAPVVLRANRAWRLARGLDPDPVPATVAGGPATSQASAAAELREGDLAVAQKHIEKAADEYRRAGSRRRLANARVLQGDIARAMGDLVNAERHFRAALMTFLTLEDRYSAARVLSALAELQFSAGDYVEAAELNRQAAERMPGDVGALTGLAYAQWYAGSPADAESTFDHALRWDHDAAPALAGRGQIRADLGEFAHALDDLDRALSLGLNPEAEVDARSARALALAGLGRVHEAEHELTATLRIDPERARSRLRAGRIAAILGHQEQMRAELERALVGRPSLSSVEQKSARRILQRFGGAQPSAGLKLGIGSAD